MWNLKREHTETEYRKVATNGWGLDGGGARGLGDVSQKGLHFQI